MHPPVRGSIIPFLREELLERARKETARRETVILVHGLWGTDLGLRRLGRRLEQAGLGVRYYRYPSWRGRLEDITHGLRYLVEHTEGKRVHLLGHSLGGIVIAKMLASAPPPRVGQVAFLGSPLRGSTAVSAISRKRLGRWLLGPVALEGIVEDRPPAPADREILVVAGTLPLGIGLLFGIPRPHDGWIQVSETGVEGARAFRSRAWHFGLLLSRKVASTVCAFFNGESD